MGRGGGGHNVKTGTKEFFSIQNCNEIKINMQLCNVKQKNAMETTINTK
jgi:hypothetical protein